MLQEDHKLQKAELATGLRTALNGMEIFSRDSQTVAFFDYWFSSAVQCQGHAGAGVDAHQILSAMERSKERGAGFSP